MSSEREETEKLYALFQQTYRLLGVTDIVVLFAAGALGMTGILAADVAAVAFPCSLPVNVPVYPLW